MSSYLSMNVSKHGRWMGKEDGQQFHTLSTLCQHPVHTMHGSIRWIRVKKVTSCRMHACMAPKEESDGMSHACMHQKG